MPDRLDTDTTIYFDDNAFDCFSNFSAFRVYWQRIDFATSAQAYYWSTFDGVNPFVQRLIVEARSAHDAFKLAELHRDQVPHDWPGRRVAVMREILQCKIQQHAYVRRKLLETGDRLLIEDSWRDDAWGWGKNKDGQNLLGKLWMELRDWLRSIEPGKA